MSNKNNFCIGIIGSGPIGLECGLHALKHGYQFIIFESGNDIANNVRIWSHVPLFTPLSMNMSSLGKTHLEKDDDADNSFLTGSEYIEQYLRPISDLLQPNIRLRHRVIGVSRHHHNDKFIVLVENGLSQCEELLTFDCVIDASGTYSCPNYVGPGNLPAINERLLSTITPSPITYRIPNFDFQSLMGKRILLIGKGHSAATSAVFLAKLKETYPETQLFWVIKQSIDHLPYCCNPDDPLEQRRQLAKNVNQLYADGHTFTKIFTNTVVTKFTCSQASPSTIDVTLDTTPVQTLENINYVIANTGLHPDRSIYANLSVHECYRSKGPMALAIQLLSSNNADCLHQTSHGASSMLTTEKNFFIVGNKSYGKQTNFLMKIGFEQVSEVFQLIHEQC